GRLRRLSRTQAQTVVVSPRRSPTVRGELSSHTCPVSSHGPCIEHVAGLRPLAVSYRGPSRARYPRDNVPRRNVLPYTDMTGSRPSRLVLGIIAMVFALATAPTNAGARVVVGGVFGVGYPYPYPYYPYPYPYPYPVYPYYGPYSVPPPGWVAGHWEWRQN